MGSSAPAGEANIIATSAPVLIDASKRSTLSPLQVPPGQYEVPARPLAGRIVQRLRILHTLCGDRLCCVKESFSLPVCRRRQLSRSGGNRRGAGRRLNYRSELARGGVSGVRLGRTARRRGFCAAWTFLSCLNLKQRVFLADFRVMGICFRLVQASGRRKGQARSRDGHACASAAVR